jgi:threonine dehydrogenase-like Zn-dependent dehydrogenase
VLGHELAVEVLALGEGGPDAEREGWSVSDGLSVGALCAVRPYLSCGRCPPCRRERPNCCNAIEVLGVTVDGGLCERMVLPRASLHTRPGLSVDQLALAETLGIGMHAVERARPEPTDSALIIGMGPIGLAIAQCLRDRVGSLVVTDHSPDRLRFAAASLKVDIVKADSELRSRLLEHGNGELPTLVLDATGSAASMEHAFALTGAGGTLVLVGHTKGRLRFDNPAFHQKELDLRASRNAVAEEWSSVLDLMSNATLDPIAWITHRPTLSSVADDLPRLAREDDRTLVKALVDIDGVVGG